MAITDAAKERFVIITRKTHLFKKIFSKTFDAT